MATPEAKGLLSVEVKAPPIVAGTPATVSLIIRNPFDEAVIIESIQAPSSAPLLPESAGAAAKEPSDSKKSLSQRLLSAVMGIRIQEIKVGPLTAGFPSESAREFRINLEPQSKLTVKSPFGPNDRVLINSAEGAEVVIDIPQEQSSTGSANSAKERMIPSQQEDLASFELKTAHWLLVKPKVLELYALIRFRVGTEPRSQVVPVTLSVQPPVKSIVLGTLSGGILGWLARQLNKGLVPEGASLAASIISILGIIVMATIISIVLSRQESSKGFVTLEDFYGAFVVGAILGYTGTQYFETALKTAVGGSGT